MKKLQRRKKQGEEEGKRGGELKAMGAGVPKRVLRIAFLNVRGLRDKHEQVVRAAVELDIDVVGVTESKDKLQSIVSSGSVGWAWTHGWRQDVTKAAAGGLAYAAAEQQREHTTLETADRDSMWLRVQLAGGLVLRIAIVYLPSGAGRDTMMERERAMEAIAARVQKFRKEGPVYVGGDLNGRLGANGDKVTNAAGDQIKRLAEIAGMTLVNLESDRCQGEFSRSLAKADGSVEESTLDYVLVTDEHLESVKALEISDDEQLRAGSDHKAVVLTVELTM